MNRNVQIKLRQSKRMTRKSFLHKSGLGAAIALRAKGQPESLGRDWLMPDESAQHKRTWMAFGAREKIWGKRLLPRVQSDLAHIARAIAKYEPVQMLVRTNEIPIARQLLGNVARLVEADLDDLWVRDTGPSFVTRGDGGLGAVDLNFNGWGNKQAHENDADVAGFIAEQSDAEPIETQLIGEGGGVEVDGRGTAILAESCFLNDNRNPGMGKGDCERILKASFGIRKVVWLPGLRGQDITDGHTDFYARFAHPGVVVAGLEMDPQSPDYRVTREHLKILRAATDASGRQFDVLLMQAPTKARTEFASKDFAAGYINFYICNGAVIAPEFGDRVADGRARSLLQKLFPERAVIQINIDGIAAGGGGIHCATQQEPNPAGIARA